MNRFVALIVGAVLSIGVLSGVASADDVETGVASEISTLENGDDPVHTGGRSPSVSGTSVAEPGQTHTRYTLSDTGTRFFGSAREAHRLVTAAEEQRAREQGDPRDPRACPANADAGYYVQSDDGDVTYRGETYANAGVSPDDWDLYIDVLGRCRTS